MNTISSKPQEMKVSYEKGEQIINHPSGAMSKITVKDMEERKAALLAEADRIKEAIVAIDAEIALMDKAK